MLFRVMFKLVSLGIIDNSLFCSMLAVFAVLSRPFPVRCPCKQREINGLGRSYEQGICPALKLLDQEKSKMRRFFVGNRLRNMTFIKNHRTQTCIVLNI